MRLHSIKLAGFKSFVDPVTLRFQGPLTAVVGPNGCGKSNVIDAIRWVMGESSARQLRGDSMSDVIFAGTAQRKPVGQASVELIFENTLGKLGGAYNSYTELSVRRQVTRDGRSDYFLNGTRCRRRDITDIFLGTGLGPRSYAVIQQGMINRLVEARPDELRVFLEEAAGVSRYQARRRETTEHLEHTRLNLARLNDVAEELQDQMKTLKRQSQAAERYKALQAEHRQLQVAQWSAEYHQYAHAQQGVTTQLADMSERFRVLRQAREQAEADWQHSSSTLNALLADAEPEQQRWQACEQDYARADSADQQGQQQQATLDAQQAELTAQLQQVQQQQHDDAATQAVLSADIARLTQQLAALPQREAVQQQVQQWDQAWYQQQQVMQHTEQHVQALAQTLAQQQHEITVLSRQRLKQEQQLSQIQQRLSQLMAQDTSDDRNDVAQAREDCQIECVQWQQRISQQQQAQQVLQHAMVDTQQQWQALHQQRTDWQAEKNALLSIHQQPHTPAMQQPTTTDQVWAQQLTLTPAGQAHVALMDAVFAVWLSAPVTDETVAGQSHQLSTAPTPVCTVLAHPDVQPLTDWVASPVYSVWQGMGLVATPHRAAALRSQLAAGQSLLTPTGLWYGADWLIDVYQQPVDASAGRLARQLRLDTVVDALQKTDWPYQQLSDTQQQQQGQATALTEQLSHAQRRVAQLERDIHQYDLQQTRLLHQHALNQQQIEQQQQQQQQVQDALNDDLEQLSDLNIAVLQTQQRQQPLQQQLIEQQQQLSHIRQQRDDAREQSRQQQAQAQQYQTALQVAQSTQDVTRQSQQRVVAQQHALQARLSQVQQAYQAVLDQRPAQIQRQQASLMAVEHARQRWSTRQTQLETVQATQQRLSQMRQQGQQDEDQLRDDMEQQRLVWQQMKGSLEQRSQQLATLSADLQNDAQPDQGQRVARMSDIERQLARLGELNLAAPAALLELTQRHDELTHQMDDLQQTIAQLEDAMRTIDQETRSLFMDTFNRVNAELQILFPKVFGGGQASLTLEDGWQSGVRLMAQPLGKKNSSIALLSGGEKALTALSLVFAIFRLNPAPFCLLDEVDAPLDDANVQRFCSLVAELSQQVQFIYISHNKLAMSMADHLLGVTMPEAGVSRLVSVNLEQAAAFGITQE